MTSPKNSSEPSKPAKKPQGPSILPLLKPYLGLIILLIFLTFLSNGLNLVIPKIISHGIDSFMGKNYVFKTILLEFGLAALFIFIWVLRIYGCIWILRI
jgi:ATP-binding cassette subfamily B protein